MRGAAELAVASLLIACADGVHVVSTPGDSEEAVTGDTSLHCVIGQRTETLNLWAPHGGATADPSAYVLTPPAPHRWGIAIAARTPIRMAEPWTATARVLLTGDGTSDGFALVWMDSDGFRTNGASATGPFSFEDGHGDGFFGYHAPQAPPAYPRTAFEFHTAGTAGARVVSGVSAVFASTETRRTDVATDVAIDPSGEVDVEVSFDTRVHVRVNGAEVAQFDDFLKKPAAGYPAFSASTSDSPQGHTLQRLAVVGCAEVQ